MKKILFAILLMNSAVLFAVPALRTPRVITQPDSTQITVVLNGDEWMHWRTTTDGYTITENSAGVFEYAEQDTTGNLKPSGVKANDPDKRTNKELKFLKKTTPNLTPKRKPRDF